MRSYLHIMVVWEELKVSQGAKCFPYFIVMQEIRMQEIDY